MGHNEARRPDVKAHYHQFVSPPPLSALTVLQPDDDSCFTSYIRPNERGPAGKQMIVGTEKK